MGLTLRDGVFETRKFLGEFQPQFWSDEEIIYDLNTAANDMCAEAGNISAIIQVPFAALQQESALPVRIDTVDGVSFYSGQLFQLSPIDAQQVQLGNRVGGLPINYYIKTSTRQLSPQGANGNIVVQQLNPNAQIGVDYSDVLGLWPIPSAAYVINVDATVFHPFVQNPLDPVAIPERFKRGWTAYAIAQGKLKESAYDEFKVWNDLYEKAKTDFANYQVTQGAIKATFQYGGAQWPSLARGSSSIIFVDQQPGLFNQ